MPVPDCGARYAPPFADPRDAGRRSCGAPGPRQYQPIHRGIGFHALQLESEACFVPDSSFQLLDAIVSEAIKRMPKEGSEADRVLAVSAITGEVLAERGFGLFIPTETLGDALVERNKSGEPARHIFDCDTGALILLTVADTLSVPASLVEITLTSGSGHNYVRWAPRDGPAIEWDTNGRTVCTTPKNLPKPEGQSMTRDQTMAYLLTMRAQDWQRASKFDRAVQDFRSAVQLFPERAGAHNNFAWMIATKEFPGRDHMKEEALRAAEQAVGISRTSNYLDTLACAHAFAGDFVKAAKYEDEALQGSPGNDVIRKRLEQFRAATPRDCTGAE